MTTIRACVFRVDHVQRDPLDGSILTITAGQTLISYDRARETFDLAFEAAIQNQSIRMLRGTYNALTQAIWWIVMREAWVGRCEEEMTVP